ncbi:hypothetical protein OC844_002546 [Tilletia horrida]|nr:hypothetical protein OC844_002546 [Tilletia horrida]
MQAAADERTDASTRVWRMPELVLLIASYLERERVDLATLSTVSRQMRAMTLPVLVRVLDIPLSRMEEYERLLGAHPELAPHIRFVRVCDDKTVATHRARPHRRLGLEPEAEDDRQDDEADTDEKQSQRRWTQLGNMVAGRAPWSKARFDIMAGIRSVSALATWLTAPALRGRVVALRIIADHAGEPFGNTEEEELEGHIEERIQRWAQLASIISSLSTPAEGPDASGLLALQIENYTLESLGDLMGIAHLFNRWVSEPPSVRAFSVHLEKDSEAGLYDDIFAAAWPRLRRFFFSVAPDVDALPLPLHTPDLEADSFLDRHTKLEELSINAPDGVALITARQDPPRCRKISFHNWRADAAAAFLKLQGQDVVDLEIPTFREHGRVFYLLNADTTLSRLRILRASSMSAALLVTRGHVHELTHVEIKLVTDWSQLMLDQWLPRTSPAARAITCLDIELSQEGLDDILNPLARALQDSGLPSLVELALCSTLYDSNAEPATEEDGTALIQAILASCYGAPRLRTVRMEHMRAIPFSLSTPIELQLDKVPAALEYVMWHATASNVTQHFRVLRTPSNVRLQRIPASFCAQISKDGEWVQPANLRQANIIFDHTRSPPCLR